MPSLTDSLYKHFSVSFTGRAPLNQEPEPEPELELEQMGSTSIFILILLFAYFPFLITAQQAYADDNCKNSSSALGYTCNGVRKSCTAFLMYRAQPPYNNLSSIASLFSANVSQISAISNMSETMTLPTNTEVLIPVTCSCSGKFYQVNTTYLVQSGDNYMLIANTTFEGLTACKAIRNNKISPNLAYIFANEKLTIPVRCACPTKKQVGEGIKYLMSFVIQPGNSIGSIATKFGADVGQTLEANKKSVQDSVIQPFTTLLVPLQAPPNGSAVNLFPRTSSSSSPPPSSPSSPTPPSSSPPKGSSNKKWAYFGVGVVVGGAFVLMAGVLLVFVLLRRVRKNKNSMVSSQSFEAQENATTKEPETEPFEFLKSISSIAALKVYSIKDLQATTENFSSDHWIKGSVYMGILDGDRVAIKKMNGDVSKEVSVLNKINHFNLIRLLGVCFDDGVWYLVYEYASNGPLSDWIYQDNPDQKNLNWGKRMQVASDVATGLNYLHSYTTPPHVHKDIKSSNILLDGDFRAKIAKFGLSRPVRGNDGQFTLTKHIVGTKGYLAPEYLENGLVTPMLDVYSFGVLLLEMLTGKDVGQLYEGVKVHLCEVLAPLLGDGNANLKGFIDPSLGEFYPEDVAISMVVLVDRCLRKDPASRPSMDEIVQILSKTLTTSLVWESISASTSSF